MLMLATTPSPQNENIAFPPHFGFIQTRYYQVMEVYANGVRCPTGFAHVVIDFLLRRLNDTYDACYDDRVGLVLSSCMAEDMHDCVLEGTLRQQIKPIPFVAVTMRFEGMCSERDYVANQLRRVDHDLQRAFNIYDTLCGQLVGVRYVAKTPVIEMHAMYS